MDAIKVVKQTCKEKGISIAKLERDCGFGNGYISKLKRGVFPIEKAQKISEYLGIDVSVLVGVPNSGHANGYYLNEETARIAQEAFEDANLRALFSAARGSRPEDLQMAIDLLRRLKGTNSDE